ncbi:unnamed protein product [Dovyalis caffra]|uniref:Uncharacterized protein n=1 Tax=Dovyalis caffra TaxID=77055 RepID=A0AAV1QWQ9_9ROSI|nr:unnamed protein product [Dovyalis caffra]
MGLKIRSISDPLSKNNIKPGPRLKPQYEGAARMVRVSVLNDALKSMYNAEKLGKRQVMIRPSSKVIIKFLLVMQKHGYIGEFEFVDDHRAGKIVVELNGRLNKCGVISPRFDVGVKEIETWTARLLPSRQFGYIVLTTSAGIMDHEEARRKNVGGKPSMACTRLWNGFFKGAEFSDQLRPLGSICNPYSPLLREQFTMTSHNLKPQNLQQVCRNEEQNGVTKNDGYVDRDGIGLIRHQVRREFHQSLDLNYPTLESNLFEFGIPPRPCLELQDFFHKEVK